MAEETIPRRSFLKGAGIVGTAAALSSTRAADAQAQPASSPQPAQPAGNEALLALTATEAAFLGAVYDTIIPADRLSPSGTECGLLAYIDRQLAGAWGSGARLYRSGPFVQGTPEQGYQLCSLRENVGMGWSGSIMARELTKAGLTVVGLERGADRSPSEDFALPRFATSSNIACVWS